jgi:RNA polymerase sigma-70 factor (ECF subfamily)
MMWSESSNFHPPHTSIRFRNMHGALAVDFDVISEPAPPLRSSTDDRRLAEACANGDTSAFEQLYRGFGDRMKSVAYNYLGNITDAEDVVQETFLKIHRGASGFTGEASFSTWLYRILVNTCNDALRKRHRRPVESPIEALTVERAGANVDEAKRMTLRKLLAELPEQRRTVFMLFEVEGLSHAEIAGILGISEGNSKWILFSTKKQLQEKWKGDR